MNIRQEGQAVHIVLLSMVVVLTVVLSVIAAGTADIKISTNEASSLRAFSAAESGIEQALISNSGISGNVNSGASFNASVTSFGLGQSSFVYPQNLVSGDNATLWFVSHTNSGTLACDAANPCFTGRTIGICWGLPNVASNLSTTPAIEISAFYLTTPGDKTTVKIVKAAYDPNSTRLPDNHFGLADGGWWTCPNGASQLYGYGKIIDLAALGIPISSYNVRNGLQFMTIKMLYSTDLPQPLAVTVNYAGNSTLPSQGSQVDSTGVLNQSSRKIEVTRSYNQVPPIFDSAVFSPVAILK